jgi:hypothetical protein
MAKEPRLCDAAKAKWHYPVGGLYEVRWWCHARLPPTHGGTHEISGAPARCTTVPIPPSLFPARAGESGGATTTRPRPR